MKIQYSLRGLFWLMTVVGSLLGLANLLSMRQWNWGWFYEGVVADPSGYCVAWNRNVTDTLEFQCGEGFYIFLLCLVVGGIVGGVIGICNSVWRKRYEKEEDA